MESASSPPSEETADLASCLAALEETRSTAGETTPGSGAASPGRSRRADSTRRAVLAAVLIILLTGGVIHVARSTPPAKTAPTGDSRANVVFRNAGSGTCLNWPVNSPDRPSFVQCIDNHMFEVAKSVGMHNFQEPCQLAVRQYLGTHYDPNSRFTISVLWAGDAAGTQSSDRQLLCGLQLLGPDGQPTTFSGRVAELDQSKVWPAGTCLGIDATNQSTDLPVDCSAPHAVEVTGTTNLAERFPGAPPTEPDQEAFIRDACTRTADTYLSPIALNSTGLVPKYNTVSPASWSAGSRQVSCGIGAASRDRGWGTLIGSAKGQLQIDGHATVAAPATPEGPPTPTSAPADAALSTQGVPNTVASQPAPAPVSAAPSPVANQRPPAPVSAARSPVANQTPPGPQSAAASTAPPPPPSPSPETPPTTDAAQVLEIPGLPPITLPVWPPPAPPPPPPGN
jgi:hypothetical protein